MGNCRRYIPFTFQQRSYFTSNVSNIIASTMLTWSRLLSEGKARQANQFFFSHVFYSYFFHYFTFTVVSVAFMSWNLSETNDIVNNISLHLHTHTTKDTKNFSWKLSILKRHFLFIPNLFHNSLLFLFICFWYCNFSWVCVVVESCTNFYFIFVCDFISFSFGSYWKVYLFINISASFEHFVWTKVTTSINNFSSINFFFSFEVSRFLKVKSFSREKFFNVLWKYSSMNFFRKSLENCPFWKESLTFTSTLTIDPITQFN